MQGVERHLKKSLSYLDRLSLEGGNMVAGTAHSEAAALIRGSNDVGLG